MGLFDKFFGKKAETSAKTPEVKEKGALEQQGQGSRGHDLPSGIQLKQEQAADAARSEQQVQQIQKRIREVNPETTIIQNADSVAPGQAGHEALQQAAQNVGRVLNAIDESSRLGISRGDVTYGGEVGADVGSMVEGKVAASGIEGDSFAEAQKSPGHVERGQEGAAMFRLSDLQDKPEGQDKKRAA